MIYILNIETSTTNCSVTLARNGDCAHSISINEGFTHAENLLTFIHNVLQLEGIPSERLSAIAVSEGPGSYTGLRIGMATAKGLCYALDIPLIAISTLEVLTNAVISRSFELSKNSLFLPMLDARRMEVFFAIYDLKLNQIALNKASEVENILSSLKQVDNDFYFFGDGAEKATPVFASNYRFKYLEGIITDAKYMAKISFENYVKNRFKNVIYFEPNYGKVFFTNAKV